MELQDKPRNFGQQPWTKIILVAVIVATIAGIFLFKNYAGRQRAGTNTSASATATGSNPANPNPTYALDATEHFILENNLGLGLPTIIDFGATSCIPCKEMAPVLKELNATLQGKAVIKFVDVWKNKAASNLVPIDLIPTQFFWNADGTPWVPSNPEAGGFKLHADEMGTHILTSHEGGLTKEQLLAALAEMGVKP